CPLRERDGISVGRCRPLRSAILGSMGAIREARGALRGGEGRLGDSQGSSVVIRAGEIETAPGVRAEQLALPLLQPPAAMGAGAHPLVGGGVADRSVVALGIGFHTLRVGGPAEAVKA